MWLLFTVTENLTGRLVQLLFQILLRRLRRLKGLYNNQSLLKINCQSFLEKPLCLESRIFLKTYQKLLFIHGSYMLFFFSYRTPSSNYLILKWKYKPILTLDNKNVRKRKIFILEILHSKTLRPVVFQGRYIKINLYIQQIYYCPSNEANSIHACHNYSA